MIRMTLGACALLAAAPALAQERVFQLDPVSVTGTPASLTAPSVDKARSEMRRIPGGVDFVPAERFRDGAAQTIKDVLDFSPGVFVQTKYGQEDARLSIRGSGLSRNFHLRGVRILLDGVPINLADGSGDFHEIDPLATRYVEVFRGANALQWGAASLGGAVNFVSPTGRDSPGVLARLSAGSFGTLHTQLAYGGVSGGFDFWGTGTLVRSDGYRDHTAQTYGRFTGNVGYRFDATAETRLYVGLNYDINEIPGALTRAQAYSTPRFTPAANFTLNTHRDVRSFRVANRSSFLIGEDQVTVSAYLKYKDLFHPLTFGVVDNKTLDWGGTAQYRGTRDLAGFKNEFTLGLNAFVGENRNRTYANIGGNRGALTNDNMEKSLNIDLYGENRFWVHPTVALIVGAQLNFSHRRLDDMFPGNGNDSGTKDYWSINPKIGALWEPTKALQVFANVSRAAEAPPFSELNPSAAPGFANLPQQKSWTVEVGTRGKLFDRVGFDVSLYRAWVKDEIQLLILPGFPPSGVASSVDRTIHQGVEVGLDAKLLKGLATGQAVDSDSLDLRVAYTYSNFYFDRDRTYGTNAIPGAPAHYVRAELRYTHPLGFYVAPNIEWVPQGYFVDNANTSAFMTDPYVLLGFKAGAEPIKGMKLFLDVRNIFDKTHVSNVSVTTSATAASALYNPGIGRAFFVGAELRL
jgi:iron complex outermembrane recepter protein